MSETEPLRYWWTPDSEKSIDDFLKTTRPSILTTAETPWIWVSSTSNTSDPEREAGEEKSKALLEAERLLKDLEKRLHAVEKDDSIPVRASKGKKSKKAVREEMHEEAKTDLKDLSIKSKWTMGKWLLFPRHSEVDATWAKLASSVASGPLRDAGVVQAKVAPSPEALSEGEQPTHLICLYMENVYDLKIVRKVLEVLLTQHGLEPSAAKSDLYTLAGIDSNHPTKLRSSLWRPAEVIDGGSEAIKALKAQYKAPRNANGHKMEGGMIVIESDDEDGKGKSAKRKSPPATGTGGSATEEKTAKAAGKKEDSKPAGKKVKSAALRYKDENIFGGASDSE